MALSAIDFSNGSAFSQGDEIENQCVNGFSKFLVIGHRGYGMNMLQSSDQRMKFIKESSIPSFQAASNFHIDFIEFDVQVTKDDFPVIFHDCLILTEEKGAIIERRVTDLTLEEFLSYGPQNDTGKMGKPLFRRTKDGRIFEWKVETDAPLCTLQEVFEKVEPSVGFNIELKFDDLIVYKEEEFGHILQVILQVVNKNAKDRPIMFSSFLPDAAQLVKKLQCTYPVRSIAYHIEYWQYFTFNFSWKRVQQLFLAAVCILALLGLQFVFFITNGGSQIYADVRRNSLEEAIKVCVEGGLHGIVAEVTSILRNPMAIGRIRDLRLSLLTYGQLNNVPEVVYVQHLLGVEGVIVDLVQEIIEAVSDITTSPDREKQESSLEQQMPIQRRTKAQLSQPELSFLMKLIPQISSLDHHIQQAGTLAKDDRLSK